MKLRTVVFATGCFAWLPLVAAAPEPSPEAAVKAPEKPLEALIHELADESFRVREDASRKIWQIGDSALEELQKAAAGPDPEQAYRARELIRKIELHITPDTDPSVIKLVERYAKAAPNEKLALFEQMLRQRAWRQMLKLFAAETNPEVQSRLQTIVDGVALIAARENLLKGNVAGAREYLEMAPANAAGLLALADFHRSQGTLPAELARAKTLKGPRADAWLLALYRASGDLESARVAADAAGENEISAAISVLLGDPVPWLRRGQAGEDSGKVYKAYTEIAIRRWQGEPVRAADLEPLERAAKSRMDGERDNGINALFLLGQTGLAETEFAKNSPSLAFTYFESLERIPEAMKILGLDPEKPDYGAWVEKRFESIQKADGEDEDASAETGELYSLANFMERRGLDREVDKAFLEPLRVLAADDERKFLDFLGPLFGDGQESSGACRLATRAAADWAGNDGRRWEDVLAGAFGSEESVTPLWDWLLELDPAATRLDRLEAMLVLRGVGTDPHHLREKWLDRMWNVIAKTPVENRKPLLEKAKIVTSLSPDLANNLKLWDMISKQEDSGAFISSRILYFTAGGRWNEAADFFLEQIRNFEKEKQDPRLDFHACAAACLRKAGRIEEANSQDDLVDKLSLSQDSIKIASGYAVGEDFVRSAQWYAKAVRMADTLDNEFAVSLELHGENLLNRGAWKETGAIFEVLAQMSASNSGYGSPIAKMRYRLQSDLGRALAKLKADRAGSVAMLDACHGMFPSDGSLADYFFPAVRKAGLVKEHDEWFKISWGRISAVVKKYPGSDNTCNTAGWLASRAARNLDEAEGYLEKALAMNPDQAAYLDTMAEIQFAKGKREKALEWSSRAVNFMPQDTMLRQQHEHFRSDPFPK